jgi:LuxR family maltose regulon positive regulatory protein
VQAGLARIRYDQNRLDKARRHIERSVALNESWHNPNHDFRTQLVLAWIEFGTGRFAPALAALERAGEIARRAPVVPFLTDEAAALRLRLWLQQGNLTAARQEARTRGWDLAQWRAFSHAHDWTLLLALLRMELARANLEESRKAAGAVAQTLQHLLDHDQPHTGSRPHLEILLLHALAAQQQGQAAPARRTLIDALRLARPQGQVRLIVDEGPAMRDLLATVSPTVTDELRAYVRELLAAFPIQDPLPDGDTAAGPLPEPLTEREMDVLRLMARGLTNQQIADRLVIARGTVKAHAAKIYAKLEVHSRARAAARARELGIL